MPVPPKTSLAMSTAKAVATATIHSGTSTGMMSGMSMPLTRKPSLMACPFMPAMTNSMPRPVA